MTAATAIMALFMGYQALTITTRIRKGRRHDAG
jgi:hypothetical protein